MIESLGGLMIVSASSVCESRFLRTHDLEITASIQVYHMTAKSINC